MESSGLYLAYASDMTHDEILSLDIPFYNEENIETAQDLIYAVCVCEFWNYAMLPYSLFCLGS
jgi:hypothetical protein